MRTLLAIAVAIVFTMPQTTLAEIDVVDVTPTHTPKEIEITQERTAKLVTFTVKLSLAESNWVTAQLVADVLFEEQEVFSTAAQVDAPVFRVRFVLPVESAASATLRLGVSAKPDTLGGTSYMIRLNDFRSQAKEELKAPAVGKAVRASGDYPRNEDAISVPENGTSCGDKPLFPKELIVRGSELMHSNKDVAVRFVVNSVVTVPTGYANGSKQDVLHLVPHDEVEGAKFSAPIAPRFLAQLKRIGVDDISEHFVGRSVTVRGTVTATGLDLYASPTMWTYHIELRSVDDVLSVTTENQGDEGR